jgi:hypothetical protein
LLALPVEDSFRGSQVVVPAAEDFPSQGRWRVNSNEIRRCHGDILVLEIHSGVAQTD